MTNVSRGRAAPQERLRCVEVTISDELRAGLRGLVALELDAITPRARADLTAREEARLGELGERRGRSFLGARMALKRLAHELERSEPAAVDAQGPCAPIETLGPDGVRPICGAIDLDAAAAHDDRFVVAVAAGVPVGVDVERISKKAVRGAHLFLDEGERRAGVDDPEVATRLWTVKEAAAKALNAPLAEAWRRTRVVATSRSETTVSLDGQVATARHEVIDGHVFTVLLIPGRERG
jgi:phosphopantetheinyl transferase (holo-ACP synthase)